MIDLHCHVLPGVDDGPPAMEDAVALGRVAAANGITTICATSHVSWDWPANGADRLLPLVDDVNAAFAAAGIAVTVLGGAEVAMTRAIDLSPDELTRLRLGGGPWLLVECPLSPAAAGFEPALHAIAGQGHRVLLAHPERCPAFHRDPALLERLVAAGMATQVTAAAFSGGFGKTVQRVALGMLEAGIVHDVASDAHAATGRAPSIAAELEAAGLPDLVEPLAVRAPRAILDGDPLPVVPPTAVRRRGFLARLRRGDR